MTCPKVDVDWMDEEKTWTWTKENSESVLSVYKHSSVNQDVKLSRFVTKMETLHYFSRIYEKTAISGDFVNFILDSKCRPLASVAVFRELRSGRGSCPT